ncbi:MAG TPA: ATP-binding protein, partial [Candidatus Binataceae bacterium]|nr:ATP-binding protein [Candidatus Binataceae bacterium]
CSSEKSHSKRQPSDKCYEVTEAELEAITSHLNKIESLLKALFGSSYGREPESLSLRIQVAEILDTHFDAIVCEWENAIAAIFGLPRVSRTEEELNQDLSNAFIRFIEHLRDPNDLRTYIHLRKHCQEGMLSRAEPSQFNTIHIALKQIILQHLQGDERSRNNAALRDVVVASIDERRLMVSWFYIESREAALRASEEKYRNSINHAPDPWYEIDPHTLIVLTANSAADKLHQSLPGEEQLPLVGRQLTDFVPDEMRAHTCEHLKKVTLKGSDQTFDLPLGPFFFDVNSALINYGHQQSIQMILHDVTHRRSMMEELLKNERLAAAGTFAAGVAHEVNNPLASISSLVQSLLPGETEPTRRTTLHTILSQITRISGTLKDLVNFARPSTVTRKAVDLNQLISETLRLVAYNKHFDGIQMTPRLAPDLAPAFADSNEIQQVLLNLLLNAADATQRDGGEIRVSTENIFPTNGERHRRAVMRVEDNGIGIPKEHLARVFDPFFTTKPAGAGVGLGLALCQRIVLGNSGTIRIDSEVGRGTSVTITLPVFEPSERAEQAALQ